jgi:hypothetical protein
MISLHLLHGFQILSILQLLLSPEVLVSLLQVSNV